MYDHNTRRALSHPLAAALLAGPWTHHAMAARVRGALRDRVRWIDWLVGEVLAAYQRPPLDRRRELAAYVELVLAERPTDPRSPVGAPRPIDPPRPAGTPRPFDPPRPAGTRRSGAGLVVAQADGPATPGPRVGRHAVPASAMGRAPWPVPPLPDTGALADWLGLELGALLWFADVRGWERRHPDGPLRHYRYAAVPKRSGGVRLLEAPKPRLKAQQRRVLHEILDRIPAHDAAHGFVPGRSVRTHAAAHAGRALVVGFDLEDCFAAVPAGRVFGVLRTAGYPEAVAHLLTGLTTNTTPDDALGAVTDWHQRKRLAIPHLPQGAPTSPALANLVLHHLDRRLTGLAARLGATYTRYADDLTFSGDERLHAALPTLRAAVAAIARDEGMHVRPDKTAVMTAGGRQRVCGVVVNVHPNLARDEYDRLKAAVHAVRIGRRAVDAQLLGRLAWLHALHPERAAKLRAQLDRAR